MRLAPEGLPFVTGGAVVLLAMGAAAWKIGGGWTIAVIAWLPIALWIPIFFRDPIRTGPRGDNLVIAPADGRVVSIAEIDEPDYVHGPAIRVSVFMNVFNVHVNRYPVNGTVEFRQYQPGRFFNASLDKASTDNEQMSLGVQSPHGPVLVRQIAGLVARRIVTDHQPGQHVGQGDRLGVIRFGSRVDTFLPPDVEVSVSFGDQVAAGETVIAEWPR